MTLADQIIEHGPVESHDEVPRWFEALTAKNINALRDELLELRRLRAAAEARERYVLDISFLLHRVTLDHGPCGGTELKLADGDTLGQLVRRADQHGKECRG